MAVQIFKIADHDPDARELLHQLVESITESADNRREFLGLLDAEMDKYSPDTQKKLLLIRERIKGIGTRATKRDKAALHDNMSVLLVPDDVVSVPDDTVTIHLA